jgi:hypothetical protein
LSSSFGQQPQSLLLNKFGTSSSAKQKSLRKENRKFGDCFFSSPNLFEESLQLFLFSVCGF